MKPHLVKHLPFGSAVLLWIGFFCVSAGTMSGLGMGLGAKMAEYYLVGLLMVVLYIIKLVSEERKQRRAKEAKQDKEWKIDYKAVGIA